MLEILKEAAEKYRLTIIEKAKNAATEISLLYLMISNRVFENFYSKANSVGRWYDPCHVAYSLLFAAALVRSGEASSLIVPAAALHDIGYHSVLVDKENWSAENSRVLHMQEGAAMAAEILVGSYFFNAAEIGAIVSMVGTHDNGYLGIKTSDRDRLALRDADRAWVMHPLSFYKDWIFKRKNGENLSLLDLFQSRLASFYGPNETYPAYWGKSYNVDKEDAIQSPPVTKLAKELRDQQFSTRFQEIENDVAKSVDIFRRFLTESLEAE